MTTLSTVLLGALAPAMRAVETPIPTAAYGEAAHAEEVFVLLPGIHDDLRSFEKQGFVAAGRKVLGGGRRVAFVAVDAHFGYYRERSIAARLKDEVLAPLAGRKVTAVGISLGGFGALITARRQPALFHRLVLIAPFLGWPEQIERLSADPEAAPRDDFEAEVFAVWRWLREGAGGLPVALLYGRDDGFAAAYDRLAPTVPNLVMRPGPGGHDWRSWTPLWAAWLGEQRAAEDTGRRDGGPLQT